MREGTTAGDARLVHLSVWWEVLPYVALPFGWGLLPIWFTQFMGVLAQELRRLGLRVLTYLGDVLISPLPLGSFAALTEYVDSRAIDVKVLRQLGPTHPPEKGK